jgi:GNAT superfamily N-acetyltransferase
MPEYMVRHCRLSDLGDIYALHQLITAQIDHDILAPKTRDYFARHIADEGLTIGAFVGGNLIAYSMLRFPGLGEDNLGRHAGIPEDELGLVAHNQETGVHPDYRGLGLQYDFVERRASIAKALGYKHHYSLISVKNRHGIGAANSQGRGVIKVIEIYGSPHYLIGTLPQGDIFPDEGEPILYGEDDQ